jgi:outer membrane protein assembly factor BamB
MQRKVISSRLIIGGIILLLVAILAGVGIANLSRREVVGAPTPTAATSSGIYTAYETTVYKFDARTGALLWHYQTANRYSVFSTVPTVVGNSVYISTGNALYALDATTGKARWQQHWGAYNNSSDAVPVVSGNIVYIVAIDGVVGNGIIYLAGEATLNAGDFHVFSALKGSNGAQLWQQKIENLPSSGANTVVIP